MIWFAHGYRHYLLYACVRKCTIEVHRFAAGNDGRAVGRRPAASTKEQQRRQRVLGQRRRSIGNPSRSRRHTVQDRITTERNGLLMTSSEISRQMAPLRSLCKKTRVDFVGSAGTRLDDRSPRSGLQSNHKTRINYTAGVGVA